MKVLSYKSDGNNLTWARRELSPVGGNNFVFTYEEIDSYYGRETVRVGIVLRLGETYFQAESVLKDRVNEEVLGVLKEMDSEEGVKNYIDNSYPNTLLLEVARLEGLNVAAMLQRREEILSQRRDAQQAAQNENNRRAEAYTQKENERLISAANDFKNGLPVAPKDFISLCEKYSVKIPPATHGMILKKIASVSVAEVRIASRKKPNLQRLFELAEELQCKIQL